MGGRKPVSPGSRAPSAACGPCGSPAGPGTGCTGEDRRPGTTRASRPPPPRRERAATRQRERNETEKGRAKESYRSTIPRPPTGEVPDPSGREGPCRGWFLQKSGRKSWVHLIISCNPTCGGADGASEISRPPTDSLLPPHHTFSAAELPGGAYARFPSPDTTNPPLQEDFSPSPKQDDSYCWQIVYDI